MSWGGAEDMLNEELAGYANSTGVPPTAGSGGNGTFFQNLLDTINGVNGSVQNFQNGQSGQGVQNWINGILGGVQPPEVETEVSVDGKTVGIIAVAAVAVIFLAKKVFK